MQVYKCNIQNSLYAEAKALWRAGVCNLRYVHHMQFFQTEGHYVALGKT